MILTDSTSVMSISSKTEEASVTGSTDVTLSGGKAIFSDVTMITLPGSVDIEYEISSGLDFTRLF